MVEALEVSQFKKTFSVTIVISLTLMILVECSTKFVYTCSLISFVLSHNHVILSSASKYRVASLYFSFIEFPSSFRQFSDIARYFVLLRYAQLRDVETDMFARMLSLETILIEF